MPLLRGLPFRRKKIPRIYDDVPLYFYKLTNEVFTDYEEFCSRIIECNSLIWTCAETGVTDLTYAEAVESEARVRRSECWYPEELKVPTLYLASITQTSSFNNLVSHVLEFIKDHYFLNEVVESRTLEWHFGRVVSVQQPEKHCVKTVQNSDSHIMSLADDAIVPADVYRPSLWLNYVILERIETVSYDNWYYDYESVDYFSLTRYLCIDSFVPKKKEKEIPVSIMVHSGGQNFNFFRGGGSFQLSFKEVWQPSDWYLYTINPTLENELVQTINVHGADITRPYAEFLSEDLLSRFLRQFFVQNVQGIWVMKGQLPVKYNIQHTKFSDIFVGDPPKFTSRGKRKFENQTTESETRTITDPTNELRVMSDHNSEPSCSYDGACQTNKNSVDDNSNECKDTRNIHSAEQKISGARPKRNHPVRKDFTLTEIYYPPSKKAKVGQKEQVEVEEIEHPQSENSTASERPYPLKKNKELRSLNNGKTSKKKLKQTVIAKQFSSPRSLDTKTTVHVMSPQTKSLHTQSRMKKRKVVATLKPWLHRTNKDCKKQSASHTKDSNSESKKRNRLQIQREIELQEEMKEKDEEQLKIIEEENEQKFAKFFQEWSKHREDLLCEDSKPLPRPCDVQFSIPNEFFGDFVMILEFLHYFKPLLKFKEYFPNGITFELLERALVETEIAGPLFDLFHLLLSSIFDLQINECEKPKTSFPNVVDLNFDLRYEEMIQHQSIADVLASGWNYVFYGVSLNSIPINPITISEILRLHLMVSGGRRSYISAGWSHVQGGYDLDDPGLWLRLEKPSILSQLSQKHVCELSIVEKLDLLSCLVNQLLTYRNMREKLEECSEERRKAKRGMRSLQNAKIKLQKKASAMCIQQKNEGKVSSSLTNADKPMSQEELSFEEARIEKELNDLKEKLDNKHSKICSASHQLLPIGTDRAHRNYWIFSSLPGLYVEYNPFEVGSCLPQPTPLAGDLPDKLSHVRRLFEEESHNASSDKENDCSDRDILKPSTFSGKKMLEKQNSLFGKLNEPQEEKFNEALDRETSNVGDFLVCTSSDNCPVHCPSSLNSRWGYFAKQEDVTCLLNNLNVRGIRESALRRRLLRENQRVLDGIEQCPVRRLNPTKSNENEQRKSARISSNYKPDSPYMKYRPGTPVSHIMEYTLRKQILNLENKITSSCIGSLKVNDRVAWRNAIRNGGYDSLCNKLTWGFHVENLLCKQTDLEITKTSEKECLMKTKEPYDSECEIIDDNIHEQTELKITKTSEKKCLMKTKESYDSECEIIDDNIYESVQQTNTSARSDKSVDIMENSVQTVCNESKKFEESYYDKGKQKIRKFERLQKEKLGRVVHNEYSEGSLKKDKCNDQSAIKHTDPESFSEKHSSQCDPTAPTNTTVKDLKSAMLQIEQGIYFKFFKKPLGRCRTTLDKPLKFWEESLMKSVNLSQLFIHVLTLENNINWAKAPIHEECCLCRKKGDAKKMVLCDNCNKGYHIYCLKPKLKCVPRGDWFCPACDKSEAQQTSRNVKRVLEKSGSSSDTGAREDMERRSARIKDRKEIHKVSLGEKSTQLQKTIGSNICSKCKLTGTVILCCICNAAYHAECLRRPMRLAQLQREDWICDACKLRVAENIVPNDETRSTTDESFLSENSEKLVHEESSENIQNNDGYDLLCKVALWRDCYVDMNPRISKVTNITTPQNLLQNRERRACSSASIAKIETFTKMLRSNSWNGDEFDEKVPIVSQEQPAVSTSISTSNTSKRLQSASENFSKTSNRSSRHAFVASNYLPLDNAILQSLIKDMICHEDSWLFTRPVRKSEAPDYHKIIKKPMDLGTVKCRLNTGVYKSNKDFINDVILVFNNCHMYNRPESVEYRSGEKLRAYFEEKCKELKLK